jgi:hypothetical protein
MEAYRRVKANRGAAGIYDQSIEMFDQDLKCNLYRIWNRMSSVQEVAKLDRCADGIVPEEIGLTLREGKDVLKQMQRNIVQTQIQVQGAAWSCCMHCGGTQLVKDIRRRQIRTVFGKITVGCRRLIRCTCRGGRPSILSPLRRMELVRCAVLDGRLDALFREQYPKFRLAPAAALGL